MAECRCGFCEHCVSGASTARSRETDPPLAPVPRERRLLTRSELAAFRDGDFRAADLPTLLDAYETAVLLLEEVVRSDVPRRPNQGPVHASDVAWLALREAEK